jgi:hypothetical protein
MSHPVSMGRHMKRMSLLASVFADDDRFMPAIRTRCQKTA